MSDLLDFRSWSLIRRLVQVLRKSYDSLGFSVMMIVGAVDEVT